MQNYREAAEAVGPWASQVRQHLHRHPEVGLDLPDTHEYLLSELRSMGHEVEHHPASGLTLRIPGHAPDGTVSVLRADMDALPVQEPGDLPFASVRDGAMHACGHDLHMAMLLAAAKILTEQPPRRDTVLAFQPGEETDRGAVRTLKHANLAGLGDATAFAIHVNAQLPAHTVNFRRDTFMAYGDWFSVDYRGPGGHASQPETAGNPIEAAAWLVADLRALVADLSHDGHLVATVTECLMGNTVNVIPTHGRLRGTLRTLDPDQRDRLIQGLARAVRDSAERARVTGELDVLEGYPAVVGDPGYVAGMLTFLDEHGWADLVQEMPQPSMVIEDFAYFLQRWPGTMVYLGAQVPGCAAFNHSADVLFDESVLPTGTALLLMAADGFSR